MFRIILFVLIGGSLLLENVDSSCLSFMTSSLSSPTMTSPETHFYGEEEGDPSKRLTAVGLHFPF